MASDPIYKTRNFECVVCEDCDIPGYMILLPTPSDESIFGLSPEQLADLGEVIARIEAAVTAVTKADRVYLLRFSEGLKKVHFHIFPRTDALMHQYLLETGSAGSVAGESLFAWARDRFRSDKVSPQTIEVADHLRSHFSIAKDQPRKAFWCRFSSALRNTYGFEEPERKAETQKKSPLIWIPAFVLFSSKLLWGAELIRFINRWLNTQADEMEVHPAWSDYYTLFMPVLTFFFLVESELFPIGLTQLARVYAAWRLFEDVGSSFHSLVTRSIFGGRRSRSEFRYLIATLLRSIEAWLSLILIWNLGRYHLISVPASIADQGFPNTLQVAYFVTTSLSTVGYGDFTPNHAQPAALILAILTQFIGITMLTILVSKAFSLVSPRIGPVDSSNSFVRS